MELMVVIVGIVVFTAGASAVRSLRRLARSSAVVAPLELNETALFVECITDIRLWSKVAFLLKQADSGSATAWIETRKTKAFKIVSWFLIISDHSFTKRTCQQQAQTTVHKKQKKNKTQTHQLSLNHPAQSSPLVIKSGDYTLVLKDHFSIFRWFLFVFIAWQYYHGKEIWIKCPSYGS